MQLVGDRFTDVSAAFGNDLATLPNYPAEIRAPAARSPAFRASRSTSRTSTSSPPGDVPNLLVAMNPAALKANLEDLPAGASIIANTDAFESRNLEKAGYAANPLEDGSLAAYTVYPVPMTSITVEAARGTGAKPRDAERSKNFFALGLISWMYSRPIDPIIVWINDRFASKPMVRDANLAGLQGGLPLRRDRRDLRDALRGASGDAAAGPVPQHLGQRGARLRADRGRPAVQAADPVRLVPDHPGLGHPARAVQAQELRCPHDAGRGRDRRDQRRDRWRVRGSAGRDRDEWTRRGPEGGGPRSRDQPRAAAHAGGRAARRTVDRAADQDRAGRPAAGDVRPPRRGAAADRRRLLAEPLLRRRLRGRPDRAEVPDPGHRAHRRLPGQRIRAVALPRRGRARRHLGAVHDRAEPPQRGRQHRVLALRPGREHPRPPVGDPGHARSDAPHRWHREAGRHRQRQLRARRTTS